MTWSGREVGPSAEGRKLENGGGAQTKEVASRGLAAIFVFPFLP